MHLIRLSNNTRQKAVIEQASLADLKRADKSERFAFNWEAECDKMVYKLALESPDEVVGLIAMEDIPHELRIDINVLEASIENVGGDKMYEGIAGCLIAYACRLAFLKGYGGFVSLTPKTALIEHYKSIYGFMEMGRKLFVEDGYSKALIEKYLASE